MAVKALGRHFLLYGAIWAVVALAVNVPQTQTDRLHYLLGLFYNDHFTNWQDGVVYLDMKARVDRDDPGYLAQLALGYARLGDQKRFERNAQEAVRRDPALEGYIQRVIKGEEQMQVNLLPGETR